MGFQWDVQGVALILATLIELLSLRVFGRVTAVGELLRFLKSECRVCRVFFSRERNCMLGDRVGKPIPKSGASLQVMILGFVLFSVLVTPWLTAIEPTPQPTLIDTEDEKGYPPASVCNDTLLNQTYAVAYRMGALAGRPNVARAHPRRSSPSRGQQGTDKPFDTLPQSNKTAYASEATLWSGTNDVTQVLSNGAEVLRAMVQPKQSLLNSVPAIFVDVSVFHILDFGTTVTVEDFALSHPPRGQPTMSATLASDIDSVIAFRSSVVQPPHVLSTHSILESPTAILQLPGSTAPTPAVSTGQFAGVRCEQPSENTQTENDVFQEGFPAHHTPAFTIPNGTPNVSPQPFPRSSVDQRPYHPEFQEISLPIQMSIEREQPWSPVSSITLREENISQVISLCNAILPAQPSLKEP